MTLTELRKHLGLSQEKMARAIDCSWRTISRHEKGIGGVISMSFLKNAKALALANGIDFQITCPCCGTKMEESVKRTNMATTQEKVALAAKRRGAPWAKKEGKK